MRIDVAFMTVLKEGLLNQVPVAPVEDRLLNGVVFAPADMYKRGFLTMTPLVASLQEQPVTKIVVDGLREAVYMIVLKEDVPKPIKLLRDLSAPRAAVFAPVVIRRMEITKMKHLAVV